MDHSSHKTPPSIGIIGAGPVGLFSVFTCGMMRLPCAVFDTLPHAGGQCQELYPDKPIYDIPGFTKVTGAALTQNLLSQIKPFDPTWHLGCTVTALSRKEDGLRLTTQEGTTHTFKAVIIAGGAGAFEPHRPPLDNLYAFEGKGVFYAVKSVNTFKGQDIVVAGGGDSAVDWALSLCQVARSLTLVHRRDAFRAAPDSLSALKVAVDQGKITLHTGYQLDSLDGDTASGRLRAVTLKSLDGKERTIPANSLLPFFGLKRQVGPIQEWGLELEKNKIIIDPTTAQTSLDGIYAVGDMATYPFKRNLILTGFAEAAQAAFAIHRQISPNTMAPLGHSTTRGVPDLKAL